MLEITIRSHKPGAPSTFQFENDALQAFLTEAHAEAFDCQVVSLRALGSPLTVSGEPLKPAKGPGLGDYRTPAAKVAGPGAPRSQAPGINTPVQEQAREAGTLRTPIPVRPADIAPEGGTGWTKPAVPEKK